MVTVCSYAVNYRLNGCVIHFTLPFLNRQSNVRSAFQLIRNKIIKPFRVEYSLRPVKTAFHGELVANNEVFISYDRQVAHTGINELFLFSLYFFNQRKGLYNEPAFTCFAVTLLKASQSLSYLRHLKHIAHQTKILKGLAKTKAIHINSNFSALTAQTFTRKLFNIYFNVFCSCITFFLPYRYPLPNVRLLS